MFARPLRTLSLSRSAISPYADITSSVASRTVFRAFSITKTMSAPNKEWLVTIPDKPDALQQRLAVRPTHLEKIQPLVQVGEIVLGGAILTEHPPVDGTPEMTGSVMIFKAETEADVRKLLENDVYTKEGVWDLDKVKIQAFKSAIRKEL